MPAEPTTPTRPYTVLEQRDLGDLVRSVLEQDPGHSEYLESVIAAVSGHDVYRPLGEFSARGARHAIRAAAKKVYGLVGCDRQMAGVVSKQLRLRPVVVKVRETVHIG